MVADPGTVNPPSEAARRPRIPDVAWSRPIGLPLEVPPRPRVPGLIDDGPWAGVPIGGLGTGSIGRTYRGDAARWHLEVGRHAFKPVAADGFSVYVEGPAGRRATVLSTLRPEELGHWGWTLPVGAGTYRALFPRAWQVFEPEALGVRLIGEQLSPVIGHDLESSALPVGTFDWFVENPGPDPVTVGVLLSWANPLGARVTDSPAAGPWNEVVGDETAVGIRFHDGGVGPAGLRGTFAIAAARDSGVELTARARFDARFDRDLWGDFADDGRLAANEPDGAAGDRRPALAGELIGGAVAATVRLAPGEARTVRFAIAWDLPVVEFGSGRRWWKRYTRTWDRSGNRAWDLARAALDRAPEWRAAIERWQAPVTEDPVLPAWYRSALFNELYFVVDGGSFWEAGEVGGHEPAPDDPGRFALLECFDYPFYDTVDVDYYASVAIAELWPELELRGIRDLAATVDVDDPTLIVVEASGRTAVRKESGTVPHDVGGPDEDPFVRPNRYRYQDINPWLDLAPKLALQAWRDIRLGGGRALASEIRPAVERALRGLAERDLDGDGLPDHQGIPDQTYDTWPMHGPSAYTGGLWLGALRAAASIAELDGDADAAAAWNGQFARAQAAFEGRLWRDGYYAFDDGSGPSSDSVMADQLAGQWYADMTGLGDLVAPDRIITALRTIHRLNVVEYGDGLLGAVNGMRPDGRVDTSSEQSEEVWVGTTYALAALMLGRGLETEAWETAAGAARVTYERGLWFRTPEAYDHAGSFRPSLYLRPLAIWAIEEARRRRSAATA
jgi:non-lysosomal glucosylceramidase